MHRGQIMISGRQHLKTDWNTLGATDQMQAPTKEFLVFGSAVAAELASSHFAAAAGTNAFADRQRQAVNDEGLSLTEQFSNQADDPQEPIVQAVQLTIEARDTQATDIAQTNQQAQGALMMLLKVFCRQDRNRQGFCCVSRCSAIILKVPGFQNIIDHPIGRYNIGVVHVGYSLDESRGTSILASSA